MNDLKIKLAYENESELDYMLNDLEIFLSDSGISLVDLSCEDNYICVLLSREE